MIDAKKINLWLILMLLLLLLLPPVVTLALTIMVLILMAMIWLLRLAAAFSIGKNVDPVSGDYQPFISVVVACANEPAELIATTLGHMSRLEYDKYEVLVLDNNNENEKNWRSIENICQSMGEKFRFVHVDHVEGYKAGALNLANEFINQKSEIIAIVDADYLVDPNFLRVMGSYFIDPKVAIVQAPQYYEDENINPGLFANYRTFFACYMKQAGLLDTVTFTGTMGMIRRSLFKEGLKWNEWCITEDTEAGIFIHVLGYRGIYLDEPFGRGLMPFTYQSLIKQRSRWSFGNMQIILKNFKPIAKDKRLPLSKKIGFLTQLVAWIRFDLVALLLLAAAAARQLVIPGFQNVLTIEMLLSALLISLMVEAVFFIKGLGREFQLIQKLQGLMAHYGLLCTMSYSWLYMILGGRLGFQVTAKTKSKNGWNQFLSSELILLLIFIGILLLLRWANINQWFLLMASVLVVVEGMGINYLSGRFRRLA